MKCVKCGGEMRAQTSGLTESAYVCVNSSCNNNVSKSSSGWTVARIAGVGLGIIAALVGIETGLNGGGGGSNS